MAFGSSPKYIQTLSLGQLTPAQFLTLAIESAKEMGWKIGQTDESGFLAYTRISMKSYGETISIKVEGGSASLKSVCTGRQIVDWGKNKKNIEEFIPVFERVKASMSPEEMERRQQESMEAVGGIESMEPVEAKGPGEEASPLATPPTEKKGGGFLVFFKPAEGYFITPLLVDLNILLFIIMIASGVSAFLPDNESLLKWGANFRPLTLEGGWWRLVSNFFLHIGFIHLLMNMYALIYIGLLLEPYLGKARFIAAYMMTGVIASVSSLWWHNLTISAGASGAIFGMYGVFLAMLTTRLIEPAARQALLTSIGIFVGYNLLNGMKGGIDNAAHIGGLLSGLIIGYAFVPGLQKPWTKGSVDLSIAVLSLLVIAGAYVACQKIPNDIGKYDEKMKIFFSNESKAMEVYHLSANAPLEARLHALKPRGVGLWAANVRILAELDKLDLPDVLHERNKILFRYCELRVRSYELLYHDLSNNSNIDSAQLEEYGRQIDSTVNSLKAQANP